MREQELNDFLHYGYIPKENILIKNVITDCIKNNPRQSHDPVRRGKEILINSFERTLSEVGSTKTHILPLSGGLDSRTILSLLEQNIPNHRIKLATWGYGGHQDARIAKKVANEFDLAINFIDISSSDIDWSINSLINYVKEMESPNQFFMGYIYDQIWNDTIKNNSSECVYWTGFMGDPVSGALLPKEPCTSFDEARERFASDPRTTLTPSSYQPTNSLPESPIVNFNQITYEEQLEYFVKQPTYILPQVVPPSASYAAPFLDQAWMSFMLSRSDEERRNRNLFKRILVDLDHRIASVPTTANNGLCLNTPFYRHYMKRLSDYLHHCIKTLALGCPSEISSNYFKYALDKQTKLRSIISQLISDFDDREITDVEISAMMDKNTNNDVVFNTVYTVASLELFLQAKNITINYK